MILKGNQRGNGSDLAIHLLNSIDNERVEIAEVYGAVAGDLYGAFAEYEAVAQGTKAEKYLYSLSINPPSPLIREQYVDAIGAIEKKLGLSDQPRAVVFHVKDGREHCHVVWSRIDVDNMKAIHMAHDKRKLMDIACELARKFDLPLPPGLKAWEAKQKFDKDTLEPSLAEKAQQDAHGITAEQRRDEITACYEQADNAGAFIFALEQKGYVLARGDRRGFVVVDRFENVHSLTRYVKGHKAKDIKAKLADLTPEHLPSVDQAKELVRLRKQAKDEGEGERRAQAAQEIRRKAQEALGQKHAKRRAELQAKVQELLTRQQAERLSLHAAQASESKGLIFRVRSTVADLIGKTPGLRSVLGYIQKMSHLDPKERQELERDALSRRHERETLDIARLKRANARVESRESQALERAMKKTARRAYKDDLSSESRRAKAGHAARQDFHEAARDNGLWRKKDFKLGDVTQEFNDASEFTEGAHRAGDDDDDCAPDLKEQAEECSRTHRRSPGRGPRKGRGYGYRREDE